MVIMKSKNENIAEYILYLWQIEDYVRAFPEAAEQHPEIHEIAEMMHSEGKMDGGHIDLAEIALGELEDLSYEIAQEEATYRAALLRLQPQLNLLKAKTDDPTMSDLRAGLILLYQVMMLRLQKKEISRETEMVVEQVTALMRYLSKSYRESGGKSYKL